MIVFTVNIMYLDIKDNVVVGMKECTWVFGEFILIIHRDEKEPLKDTGDDGMKRNSSVEFDGRRVYATSGGPIIGKNSAV